MERAGAMGADQGDVDVGLRRRGGREDETTTLTGDGEEKKLERSLSNKEKAMELWCNVKHQLVEYSALPEYLKDNSFIVRYYRADWSFKHSLYSMFSMHNETLNVWS